MVNESQEKILIGHVIEVLDEKEKLCKIAVLPDKIELVMGMWFKQKLDSYSSNEVCK